jgi:DNA-binding transcriptional LysR family regulator
MTLLTAAGVTTLKRGYDLVWQKGRALTPGARAFRDWVLAQAAPFESAGV